VGTTLTIALGLGTVLLIARVGDSPANRFRQGGLRESTRVKMPQAMADRGSAPHGVPSDSVCGEY
jgi:serine/threonine protein phosphatase PrpC